MLLIFTGSTFGAFPGDSGVVKYLCSQPSWSQIVGRVAMKTKNPSCKNKVEAQIAALAARALALIAKILVEETLANPIQSHVSGAAMSVSAFASLSCCQVILAEVERRFFCRYAVSVVPRCHSQLLRV